MPELKQQICEEGEHGSIPVFFRLRDDGSEQIELIDASFLVEVRSGAKIDEDVLLKEYSEKGMKVEFFETVEKAQAFVDRLVKLVKDKESYIEER